jgi:hypothetical protein
MYGYSNPGPTQNTNIRINRVIRDNISRNQAIDIFAFNETEVTKRGIFILSIPAALEDSIIEELAPEWNA